MTKYIPARIDKNSGNVWKWKKVEDDGSETTSTVPSNMMKPANDWLESEISALFLGVSTPSGELLLEVSETTEPVIIATEDTINTVESETTDIETSEDTITVEEPVVEESSVVESVNTNKSFISKIV